MSRFLPFTILLALTPQLSAQGADVEHYVATLYRNILGREPKSREVADWAHTIRGGTSMREVQILFLASEEYLKRHRYDVGSHVDALFAHVHGRGASPRERQHWVERAYQYGHDRTNFVREFVQHAEARGRGLPWLPVADFQPRQEWPARQKWAARHGLADTAQQLVGAVHDALGPGATGLLGRTSELTRLAGELDNVLAQDRHLSKRARQVLNRVEEAFHDIRARIHLREINTPEIYHALRQFEAQLGALRR